MNYIVLDLEWNQAPTRSGTSSIPTFEIIEIGAVKLNEQFQVTDSYQSLIKPKLYSTMHKYTAEIVNLDMSELKKERGFKEVAQEFLDWCGEDYIFCIWGVQDLTELQRNMDYYEMEPLSKGPLKYYDVQKLYSLACEDGRIRSSLSHVVEKEQILEEVPFHRAYGDAYYTARIFSSIVSMDLLDRVSYDTYRIPTNRFEQVFRRFDNYTKFISQGYEERASIKASKTITCVRCVYCDKALRKKIPWYTPNNGKHYYTVAKCTEHGFMKGKIRVRKNKEELYYVVKTVKHVTEAEAQGIIDRKGRHHLNNTSE